MKVRERYEWSLEQKDQADDTQFLAWGSVECHPIAIFKHKEAVELAKVMRSAKQVDDEFGEVLGRVGFPIDA